MKTVFVNPERCIGCRQCELACAVAHSRTKHLYEAVFEYPRPQPRIHVAPGTTLSSSFPNKCRHCDPAPCMTVCPTGAISRDVDMDIVLIDENRCITCAMCAMVCPFDVIRYHESAGHKTERVVALKCDHCIDRQHEGQVPACVEACKVGALVFGDINELIEDGSLRLARVVSVAVSDMPPELSTVPANVQSWRDIGAQNSQIGR